jgi:hypothetical protein
MKQITTFFITVKLIRELKGLLFAVKLEAIGIEPMNKALAELNCMFILVYLNSVKFISVMIR